MQLVLLAAGHGRRFGGLKQLAPVGPDGEALMDYTARDAQACGFAGVVVVVREEIRGEIAAHVRQRWPASLPVELVAQAPIPGTAQAVLSARAAVEGGFAVANADDLYGDEALDTLLTRFSLAARPSRGPDEAGPSTPPHVLVGYRLQRTILTSAPVTRGLCEVGPSGDLRQVVEHMVQRDGDAFLARPAGTDLPLRQLGGRERVSMNLWGFHPRIFDHLARAIAEFDPARAPRPELALPDVVNSLVRAGRDEVQVVGTTARCIGVTHQDDLPLVRHEIALANDSRHSLGSPSS